MAAHTTSVFSMLEVKSIRYPINMIYNRNHSTRAGPSLSHALALTLANSLSGAYIRFVGRILTYICGLCLYAGALSGQSVTTEFGKNRVQFHDDFDNWDMYETENFVTYWYGKGREIAHTVVQMAELDNPAIQNVLEHKMNDKIELIVYVDLTDLKQTNIGIEDQFINRSGITKVVDNKVFLYFNGNHNDLRKALREGIASVYINSMLHGANLQEIVQNAVLLNLPDWFQEGLVSYIGETWNTDIDSRLRDYFSMPTKKKKDFARLSKSDPKLAGHCMWFFIATQYGKATISNILYLTRIHRSLENGLIYVLGFDSRELARQWKLFYERQLSGQSDQTETFRHDLNLVKQNRLKQLGRMAMQPGGKQLAYTINDNGRVRVVLYDMATGDKKILFRYGVRNHLQEPDLNYPVLAWHPDGRALSFLYERRDVIFLRTYDFDTHDVVEGILSPEYHRVYDMDFWASDTLMLTATTDGYSDLYLYSPVSRQSTRITHDFYDDLDASVIYMDGQRYILFSSNRKDETFAKMELDSILPLGLFDLFMLKYENGRGELRQLTFTPKTSERHARMSGNHELICLADQDGRWQRLRVHRLDEEPPEVELHTRFDRDILRHEYVEGSPVTIDLLEKWNKTWVQVSPIDSVQLFKKLPVTPSADKPHDSIIPPSQQGEEEMNPGYLFQTPFPGSPVISASAPATPVPVAPSTPATATTTPRQPEIPVIMPATYKPAELVPFLRPRIIASRLRFKLDYFNTYLDNSLLFGGLDSYAGTGREFQPATMGFLVKARVTDLLENYIITGGARFPTSFNGSEYFLVFDNRKRRIDRQYALYRKSIVEYGLSPSNPLQRNQFVTFLMQTRLSYPFDVYHSVRATGTIRNDRNITLATDGQTLAIPVDDAQRLGVKLEWVYDNARDLDINSRTGTRAKGWVEVVKRFDLNLFEAGPKLLFNKGFMTVVGFDGRHYVSPDRRTIFAFRATGATSFGSERILYYLGGVENGIFSTFDNAVSVPGGIDFAYTTLAANMRGYRYNARNGSSVMLVNAEVRVPVFQYLSREKIRSSFLRNFQITGFVDAGTAWHGSNPFGRDNPLNTVVLTQPPTVQVIVNYYRNPVVLGYGSGVRTMLFGYLAKLDCAWNWEKTLNQRPLLHFSLGTDF